MNAERYGQRNDFILFILLSEAASLFLLSTLFLSLWQEKSPSFSTSAEKH
jgi:hypothetical protein